MPSAIFRFVSSLRFFPCQWLPLGFPFFLAEIRARVSGE